MCQTRLQTLRARFVETMVCEHGAALKHMGCFFSHLDFCDLTTMWRLRGWPGDRQAISDLTQGTAARPERTGQMLQ